MARSPDDRTLPASAMRDALVNAFSDVGFILDAEGRYVEVLARSDSEPLLYDDPEALLGSRVSDVFDAEMAETVMANVRAALETGALQSFEYELDVGDGQRWFEARVAPVPDDASDHVVYVARDVTERERQRRQLERREGYLTTMLDSLDDVFYALDCTGDLVDWNRTVETVTGYESEELTARAVHEVFGDCAAQRLKAFVDEVEEAGSAKCVTEIETRAGARIPYEFVASRFEDPHGEDLVVGIGRDVSERVEREEQVRVFGRVLRHNMRNKMTVIDGTAETLGRPADGETETGETETGEAVERIRAAARDLTRLTEKAHEATEVLLEESRVEPLDVDAVARDVAADGSRRFADARVTYSGDRGATATAVPAIRLAIEELLENAAEHAATADRDRPEVRLSVEERPDEVVVTVSDNGPGLPAHEANIVTEERDISPVFHASGIGLWLVRWIVKRSRGDLDLVADGDRGTTVRIRLSRVGDGRSGDALDVDGRSGGPSDPGGSSADANADESSGVNENDSLGANADDSPEG